MFKRQLRASHIEIEELLSVNNPVATKYDLKTTGAELSILKTYSLIFKHVDDVQCLYLMRLTKFQYF